MRRIRTERFRNGGRPAVRLGKANRFALQREVPAHRKGQRCTLEAAHEWSTAFRSCLGSIDEDLSRPKQDSLTRIRTPFD